MAIGGSLSAQTFGLTQPFRRPTALPASYTPHPAVARVYAAETGATSSGSGTLVAVNQQYGLVLTNWHVVRDAEGEITVVFPDGFRSSARLLKVDRDWDLAALAIWRPRTTPISIASIPPQPGDPLTIAGYGQGQYRAVTARCTQFIAPGPNQPYEMIEVSAQAREGDSGGPILNQRGELAGVLFGAARGTTAGSQSQRVRTFLADVWPAPTSPPASVAPEQTQIAASPTPLPTTRAPEPHQQKPIEPPQSSLATQERGAMYRLPQTREPESVATSPDPRPAAPKRFYGNRSELKQASIPVQNTHQPRLPLEVEIWNRVVGTTPFEKGKTALAAIGLLAVAIQFSRLLGGSRRDEEDEEEYE